MGRDAQAVIRNSVVLLAAAALVMAAMPLARWPMGVTACIWGPSFFALECRARAGGWRPQVSERTNLAGIAAVVFLWLIAGTVWDRERAVGVAVGFFVPLALWGLTHADEAATNLGRSRR